MTASAADVHFDALRLEFGNQSRYSSLTVAHDYLGLEILRRQRRDKMINAFLDVTRSSHSFIHVVMVKTVSDGQSQWSRNSNQRCGFVNEHDVYC